MAQAVPFTGPAVTTTATDADGNTSEFSAPMPVLLGDASRDGSMTMVDAMFTAQGVVGLRDWTTMNPTAADVNCDGRVTMVDAMLVAQYVVFGKQFTCSVFG